ncbi:AI-2E family transporter [Akkermansiaceae bacterium]|nr:AI-2E family transporter [Akkermansiaceae bacterium]
MLQGKSLSTLNIMISLACLVVVITGLKLGASLFVPILLALFVATVSYPMTRWLRNRKLPMFLAVLITVFVDFLLMGGVIVFLITTLGQLKAKWNSEYLPIITAKVAGLRDGAIALMERFVSKPEEATTMIDSMFAEKYIKSSLQEIEAMSWWVMSKSVFDFFLSAFGFTLLVVLLTIFMLNEATSYGRKLDVIKKNKGPDFERLKKAFGDIQQYLGIKTIISAGTGLLAYIMCLSAGIEFPLLWGVLAFALNFIPAIGSIIAGIPPIILAILMKDVQVALFIALGYFTINLILGNMVEPMLMGRKFGLSTVIVILSVLFWGWVWGPVGMLLGVPLTMILKVALDNSDYFSWLSYAISKEEKKKSIIVEKAKEGLDKLD